MFASVLIANRGEIACRIIRTAKRLGLRTIAIYSEADAQAPHVALADEAYCVGPPPAAESYLNAGRILAAAGAAGADCLHPGYGFLAENHAFAEACALAGIIFIGPPPGAIRLLGLKHEAKALMAQAGVPVAPGTDGAEQDVAGLEREAERIGYPVLLKPVAGGGGKGMRRVGSGEEMAAALEGAVREAQSAFGDGRVMLEKYLDRPRHIEVQVFADSHGNAVHLFERDCSLQRRHQKIIEEAPAPGMDGVLRARMCQAALTAAATVGYVGAGTVEFLVEDAPLNHSSSFYFLEMNTRLQVEHPVTEAITGLDLVEWQFRVAAGEPLPLRQKDIRMTGHAFEARLYAEDPDRGFLPSTGKLYALRWPEAEDLRIDTGVVEGSAVSPYYDPMLAKLIAQGATRADAIARLRSALERTLVAGPRTNLAFLHRLLGDPAVAEGLVDTGLVDREAAALTPPYDASGAVRRGVLALLQQRRHAIEAGRGRFSGEARSPWSRADAFQLGPPRRERLSVLVDGEAHDLEVAWTSDGPVFVGGDAEPEAEIVPVGDAVLVLAQMRQTEVRFPERSAGAEAAGDQGGVVRAPMHGRITKVYVEQGQAVGKGQRLAVLEAMKMEHVLHAPRDGWVEELKAREGEQLEQGAVVVLVGEEEA